MLDVVRKNTGVFRNWTSICTLLLVCGHALRTRVTGSDFKKTNSPLIVHGSHHKVMTTYFSAVFRLLAFALNLKYQMCAQEDLEPNTEIFFQTHSRIDFSKLPSYRGTHIVRDPRDVIVSGYFYHRWAHEPWCAVDKAYGGMSYRDRLNILSKEEGLCFEIDHVGQETLSDMDRWDYNNPVMLELKYEQLITERESLYRRIFQHYGFEGRELELCIALMKLFSFSNRTGRKLGQVAQRSHLRSGAAGSWREHLTEAHKVRLKELCGPLFVKLGYERNNDW